MSSFQCDKCGLCCRNIGRIPQLREYDDGNGACKYLQNNLCSIYEDRPEICRVDVMYDRYFREQYSKDEFYELNYEGCRELKRSILKNKHGEGESGRGSFN